MRYLLDANTVGGARFSSSAALMAWLSDQEVDDLDITVVTIPELERGIRLKGRADPERARSPPRCSSLC